LIKTDGRQPPKEDEMTAEVPEPAGETTGTSDILGSEEGGTDEFGPETGGTDEFGPEKGGTDEFGPENGGTDEFGPETGGGADVMGPLAICSTRSGLVDAQRPDQARQLSPCSPSTPGANHPCGSFGLCLLHLTTPNFGLMVCGPV
jgi:hypothetical protein